MYRYLKDIFFKFNINTVGNLVFSVLFVIIITGGVIKIIDGIRKLKSTATVTPPTGCPSGQILIDNKCQCEGNYQVIDTDGKCICSDGYEELNDECVPVCGANSIRGGDRVCACVDGYEKLNDKCVPVCGANSIRGGDGVCACVDGYEKLNDKCVPVCGANSTRGKDGDCVCDNGFEKINGECVKESISLSPDENSSEIFLFKVIIIIFVSALITFSVTGMVIVLWHEIKK